MAPEPKGHVESGWWQGEVRRKARLGWFQNVLADGKMSLEMGGNCN
jgi:hypothetical protein